MGLPPCRRAGSCLQERRCVMCISNSVGNGGVNTPNDVRCVQLLLNMNRDHCGLASDLVVDGLWGPGTRNALGTFCSSIGARSDTPLTDEIGRPSGGERVGPYG